MKIGLSGFLSEQPWISVDHVKRFYLDVLSKKFEVNHFENLQALNGHKIEALMVMNSSLGWQFSQQPSYPLIYVMNGSVVLCQEFLYQYLKTVETTDMLIVNCKSDFEKEISQYTLARPGRGSHLTTITKKDN